MDLVERLIQLVAIPSVSGGEQAICDWIERESRAIRPDWHARRLGNNLVFGPVPPAGESKGTIALVGHLDTVPPQGNERPSLRDGCVYGVGSSDMKAGVAVMWDLLETLDVNACPYTLYFIFYDNEETAYDKNGLGFVLPAFPELRNVDLAFVLEPTNLDLEMGCNGHVNVEVTFHGTSAHSARTWLGDNAVHKAGAFIQRLAGIPIEDVSVAGIGYKKTIAITSARAGIARNVVPDRFTLNVNHRFPPGGTIPDARAYVESLVPAGATTRLVDAGPAGRVPENNAILRAFQDASDPLVKGKQGWTDVARLTEFGVDAVNFGPGIPELAHRVEEHVPVEQLHRGRAMLERFLLLG